MALLRAQIAVALGCPEQALLAIAGAGEKRQKGWITIP
jgi:hypothetical protein